MATYYLFILTILAGASQAQAQIPSMAINAVWKSQWVHAGNFLGPDSCRKAAASLGLSKAEYRCIGQDGEAK